MHQRIDPYYNPRHHRVHGPSIQTYQCLQLGKRLRLKKNGELLYTTVEQLNGKKKKLNIVLLVLQVLRIRSRSAQRSGFRQE